MRKNNWDILFDHVRFDFGVRGIIIYNSCATWTRVGIVGYPFVRNEAVNDNDISFNKNCFFQQITIKDCDKILLNLIPSIYKEEALDDNKAT